jgi:hypothetical protein
MKMKNLLKLSFAAIFASILFIGCSAEDNPLAPTDPGNVNPPVVINTPRYMHIESISVTGFPENKPNGDTWDWDPFSSNERKPDIHVVLQRSGGNYLPAFWSDQRKNADYNKTYTFTKPVSAQDGKLPHDVPYSQTWKVSLVDKDFGGFEQMGSVTVTPSSIYGKDNATNFNKTLTSGSLKIKVKGAWIY